MTGFIALPARPGEGNHQPCAVYRTIFTPAPLIGGRGFIEAVLSGRGMKLDSLSRRGRRVIATVYRYRGALPGAFFRCGLGKDSFCTYRVCVIVERVVLPSCVGVSLVRASRGGRPTPVREECLFFGLSARPAIKASVDCPRELCRTLAPPGLWPRTGVCLQPPLSQPQCGGGVRCPCRVLLAQMDPSFRRMPAVLSIPPLEGEQRGLARPASISIRMVVGGREFQIPSATIGSPAATG